MGKKILKWAVILGGIGLFAFVIYSTRVVTHFSFPNSERILEVDSVNTTDTKPKLDIMSSKIESLLKLFAEKKSERDSVRDEFNSLTFGYSLGTGLASEIMFVTKMVESNKISSNYYPRYTQAFIKLQWLTLKRINENKDIDNYFPMLTYRFYNNGKYTYLANHKTNYKKINFFIRAENDELHKYLTYDNLNIYVPLKDNFYYSIWNWINIVYTIFTVLSYLFIFWNSGSLLLAISNNKPFEWKNVMRLKQCVWTLLILIFLPYILMISLYLCFYKILNGYVEMKSWMDIINWKLWIILVIYFSLFLAFFRGNKLQTDQEYTI
ncbi:DUF2975 domain-containing protein [Rhizosphaericola mali]|uniref:DUF2975 domain-containing protein n=1 Tax=Rhizosphaericola mali TaxID=2545455 RepID=A0A5P2G7D0_9BACT|nr:DUF2975 domain-containing protein [Rhizosphaericola mali]QES87421.1 DUF2975 domain-containing protein [Rhizosphaericola mali]